MFSFSDWLWLCWYWISWTGLLIFKNLFFPVFLPFILLFYLLGVFLNFIFPPFLWVFILKISEKNSATMFYFSLTHLLPLHSSSSFSSLLFCSLNVPWIAFCSGFTAQFLLNHHNLFAPSLPFCLFLPWVFSYYRLSLRWRGSWVPLGDNGGLLIGASHRVVSWADSWGTSSWHVFGFFVPGLVIFLPGGEGLAGSIPSWARMKASISAFRNTCYRVPLYLVNSLPSSCWGSLVHLLENKL